MPAFATDKCTLYTFAATTAASFRSTLGDQGGQFDMLVGENVDPTRWNVVAIDYPGAHLPWDGEGTELLSADFSLWDGIKQGASVAIATILKTPGGFAFCGYSQGCAVAWLVYLATLPGGQLYARAGDYLGATMFGSPVREEGHTIPGGTDPGGHGCYPAQFRATSTPSSWWDFADSNPLDPFTTVGDDEAGQLFTAAANIVLTASEINQPSDFLNLMVTLMPNLAADWPAIWQVMSEVVFPFDPNSNTSGHANYGTQAYQGLPGNTQTAVQLAVQYINAIGVARQVAENAAVAGPPPPNAQKAFQLRNQMQYFDIYTRAAAADELTTMANQVDPEWKITVCDAFWNPMGELGDDMIDLQGADPRNQLPSGTLLSKGGSRFIDAFMNCRNTMVGIIIETEGIRMPYYVVNHDYEFQEGTWVSTCHLKGIWDILNFYQIWPDWTSPIQAQLFSHAVFLWGLCTVLETMVAECALRLQSGMNEFVNNVLSLSPDFAAWIGTLLQDEGNKAYQLLKTPMYVVRTDPSLDASPLVCRTVRMESCGSVITDLTRPYGVDANLDLWLPGDPQPDQWANLTLPTYVFSTKDRSQITGPTKTVLDSVIRTVVDLEGSLLGNVLDPLLNPTGLNDQTGLPVGTFIAPTIGVDYVMPWVLLVAPEEGDKQGSVYTCKISDHTPQGWQHIIGGRSPKWLNDLMNATYAWMIDSVSILIGFSGIPSNLLDGFLNNSFLAFQLIEHYGRRSEVGPYHPGVEVFHATSSSPYNIETVFAFVNALWDSRGYTSAMVTFRNGEVYTYGRDVARGGLMSLLYHKRTKLYTDYIENLVFHINDEARDILVQIGDGRAEEAPMAKQQRFITGIFESVNVLTLAPQS